jgi:hypothetical protein
MLSLLGGRYICVFALRLISYDSWNAVEYMNTYLVRAIERGPFRSKHLHSLAYAPIRSWMLPRQRLDDARTYLAGFFLAPDHPDFACLA